MKKWLIAGFTYMFLFLFAGIASAHVTVKPIEVSQGSYEVFTVRVPSETSGTTTKQIEIKVPDGVEVLRIEPKYGWTYSLNKGTGDKIIGIVWKAEGEGLKVTEFTEFRFQGKVGVDVKELNWKAYQTYADGSKVDWVEASDGQYPASITVVTPATGTDQGHGGSTVAQSGAATGQTIISGNQQQSAANGFNRGMTIFDRGIAIAAFILGVIAIVISFVCKPRKG
ncbi:YcnI family protein [Paenibacillus sp. GCM10012306]|uniref:YcnI family copper-binding membrane protein n=1 Tax=Paenibacillus sp. GCM10012306 TaxID=3317342 RepID=UPI00360E7176